MKLPLPKMNVLLSLLLLLAFIDCLRASGDHPLEFAAASGDAVDANGCKRLDVKFIMLDGDATLDAIEDDIVSNLAVINTHVTTSKFEKDPFNTAMNNGDWNLAFSETWGPPYDPHSYAKSWESANEAFHYALEGLPSPNTKTVIEGKIDAVLIEEDAVERQTKWTEILEAVHSGATIIPISGKTIPAVYNDARLSGYVTGQQQFDYPMHTIKVLDSNKNITVAPGSQGGLFTGIGRGDPHTYRPNEFFSSNWLYDGLLEYGKDGELLPALATDWSVAEDGDGEVYSFTLRTGVTFHDGADWNCAAALLNFNHVMADPLRTADWHGWYGFPEVLADTGAFSCDGEVFKIKTKVKYYPLLQELTYIRPTRMLSPEKFPEGPTSDPYLNNSCAVVWGTIDGVNGGPDLVCSGTTGISGTGRWMYVETEQDANNVTTAVVFKRNPSHWDMSSGDVEFITLKVYADADAVEDALIAGNLDIVVGSGVLAPSATKTFETLAGFAVKMTEPIMNRIVIFNTAKAPTDNIQNRKAMIHAIDKEAIIDAELSGIEDTIDALFPKDAPYCHGDLTPKWSYDIEKAELLNCPTSTSSSGISTGTLLAIVLPISAMLVFFIFVVLYMRSKEMEGKPVYSPLVPSEESSNSGNAATVPADDIKI